MQIPMGLKKLGIEQAVEYISKAPEKNLPKLMDWADRFAGDQYGPQRDAIRDAVNNPDNIYHQLILRIVDRKSTRLNPVTY